MGRIRTIKPEFPQSESMGGVSRDGRLLFVLLWTIVDDDGRTRGAARMLASLLFPYDDDAPSLIDGWLAELAEKNCIQRYEIEGTSYLEITNWRKHQKIDHPSKSKLPPPPEASPILARISEGITNAAERLASNLDTLAMVSEAVAPDLGPRTLDQVAEDARARSMISPEAFECAKRVAILEGRTSSDVIGYAHQIHVAMGKGATIRQIEEAVRRGMESLKKPPRQFSYYLPIIAEVMAEDARPLPEVQYAANQKVSHARNAKTVQSAAGDLARKLRQFDEPIGSGGTHPVDAGYLSQEGRRG